MSTARIRIAAAAALAAAAVACARGAEERMSPGFEGRTAENRAKILAEMDARQYGPYDLLPRVEIRKFKALVNDLVFGKNVESKYTMFASVAKKQTAEGAEAAAILKGLKDSQARIARRIEAEIARRPSQALEDIDLYAKTWPSHAGDFAEAKKTLSALPDMARLRNANKAYHSLSATPPRNKSMARTALGQAESQRKNILPLQESANKAMAEEAQALVKGFDALIRDYSVTVNARR